MSLRLITTNEQPIGLLVAEELRIATWWTVSATMVHVSCINWRDRRLCCD